jgi:hypothetical protein
MLVIAPIMKVRLTSVKGVKPYICSVLFIHVFRFLMLLANY